MGNSARYIALALMCGITAAAVAQDPTTAPTVKVAPATLSNAALRNHILGFTAWDEDYLYVAVQVNKPSLNGSNTTPFSNPILDDAVLISIQSDNDRAAMARTAHSVVVVASAVGGAQVYLGPDKKPLFNGIRDITQRLEAINKGTDTVGDQTIKRGQLLGSVVKFQVAPHGTPRTNGDASSGYTVEFAIPWVDLGGRPQDGAKMGFNVAAQSIAQNGDTPPLMSLSNRVKTAADLDNPSLWGQIVFSNAPAPSVGTQLISPRVFAHKPVIDGDFANGEWNGLSGFEFGERPGAGGDSGSAAKTIAARSRPEFTPRAPRPAVALPQERPLAPLAAHTAVKAENLVLALYDYWFQADSRKAAPTEHVVRGDGGTALAHHPLDGVGPWLSYDHANWHRRQLMEARQAGVDVILPVYRGDARDRQLYADKGLTVMASVLQQMSNAGQDYPQVGLFLDTTAMSEVFGDRPDLREAKTQAALYDMVRNFYRHIPATFRCTVNTSSGVAYPVFLSDADAFKDLDDSFVGALRQRFAADFDGADLVILGNSNFKPKAKLDGYFTETREKGFQFDGDGWIKTASVGPGYDSSYIAASATDPVIFRARREGETYRSDWIAALAKHPDWVMLDGWNDYGTGSEVAASIEAGFSTADLTKVYTRIYAASNKSDVKYLWHNVPSAMPDGSAFTVHVRAQNAGLVEWGDAPGGTQMSFGYQWLRDGRVLGSGPLTPLANPVLAGNDFDFTLPVTATASGAPLPEGPIVLEITSTKKALGKPGVADPGLPAVLRVPVMISNPAATGAPAAWRLSIVSTDLPTMLESGSIYQVHATLRNDGTATWKKAEGAHASLRLYRTNPVANPTEQGWNTESTATRVESADASVDLGEDVAPGHETTVRLLLPITDVEGKPLGTWTQDDLWSYLARWEVATNVPAASDDRSQKATVLGAGSAPTPIAVVDYDFGVRFLADGTPSSLPGDRRQPVRLSLQNAGPQTWKKDVVRVGYHWYYQDGSEAAWEDETTALPQDVGPGENVKDILAWVTAPPNDGTYYLVWDVKFGDTWASTSASTRIFDQSVRQVQVVSGRLIFADLSKAYNMDGITEVDDLNGGDFDGLGHTFPSAQMPPFANTAVVPAGMWLPSERTGPDSTHRISFRWGPKEPKAKNFIACKGQRLELGKSAGQCRLLHIIAASTGKNALVRLKLFFQEPTSLSEDDYSFSISRWDSPPAYGEDVAFVSPRHHERSGIQPGAVALYHYVIRIHEPRKLMAIEFPNTPEVKIAAITLEK